MITSIARLSQSAPFLYFGSHLAILRSVKSAKKAGQPKLARCVNASCQTLSEPGSVDLQPVELLRTDGRDCVR
ncbi:MAG: hypothetical protein JWR69_2 [Pedosphaera sp.]|nr:hypothetical protein [Pedosphaera sp.]